MKQTTPPSLIQRFVGEAVGTYLLVLFVIGAYFITLATGGNALSYGITYGVTLALIIFLLGKWSRQFNPIVSLVLFIIKQQTFTSLVVALAGQLVGSVLAALTARPLVNLAQGQVSALVPTLSPESIPLSVVTTVEGIGIIFLLIVYVWASLTEDKQKAMLQLPWLAGLSVIPGSVVATVVSGAALNPMRVVGAAIVEGKSGWQYHWVYWVGPLVAALIVTIVVGLAKRFNSPLTAATPPAPSSPAGAK